MTRYDIISRIGRLYLTSNIENDEYSFVKAADRKKGKEKLEAAVGAEINHFKADIRFSGVSKDGSKITVLVETKQDFKSDEENAIKQLEAYVRNERAIHRTARIIAILANTSNDEVKVWKIPSPDQKQDKSESFCNSESFLENEKVLYPMSHYMELFELKLENDKERVVRNTYKLNKLLHKMGIGEDKRSQLVGTCLLFMKQQLASKSFAKHISSHTLEILQTNWEVYLNAQTFIGAIEGILKDLLKEPSNERKDPNKQMKIDLLEKNVLNDQT